MRLLLLWTRYGRKVEKKATYSKVDGLRYNSDGLMIEIGEESDDVYKLEWRKYVVKKGPAPTFQLID